MKIIVQKFGGTSTGTPHARTRIYDHIQRAVNDGYKIIAVVSAMGRFDDPYATDTLYALPSKGGLNGEELDRLASLGEIISSLVVKSEFMNINYNVTTLTNEEIGIITDDHFSNANILEVDPAMILEKLEKYDVVICPGFQGHTRDHIVTTLGRGGSDLTALALAIALKAEFVEIYSDVSGVFTADPRLVPNAFRLPYISHQAMFKLSLEGSQVLNHRCVEMAKQHNVTIHARSSFSNGWGTLVSDQYAHQEKYVISGVTGSFNNALIHLHHFNPTSENVEMMKQQLLKEGVKVLSAYYQNGYPGTYSLIVNEEDAPKATRILNDLRYELNFSRIVMRGGIGRISIVGDDLASYPKIYEDAVYTLLSKGINIINSDSEDICARFFVDKKDMREAEILLHDHFFSQTKEEYFHENI